MKALEGKNNPHAAPQQKGHRRQRPSRPVLPPKLACAEIKHPMKPMFKKQKEKGKGDQRLESRRDHGGKAALPSGEPICFSTNISSCSGAADGAKCSKART